MTITTITRADNHHRLKRFLPLFALALILAACGGLGGEPRIVSTAPPPTAAPADVGHPVTPPNLALGAQIFTANCTECHGATGAGDGQLVINQQVPPPPAMTDFDTARARRPADYFDIITNGRIENLMPPWRDALTEEQRWAVTMYTYTLGYEPAQISEGQAIYAATCAECHGDTGKGDGPRAAELSRPVRDLSDSIELISLQDSAIFNIVTEGQGPQMPAFADDLTETQRWAVTTYVRSLSLAGIEAIGGVSDPNVTAEATADVTPLTITGQVTNGSSGGEVPADFPLTLYIVIPTPIGFENETVETQAATDGTFNFPDIPVSPENNYVVTASYRDRLFTSDLVNGVDLLANPTIPLTIYELTEDPTVIRIKSTDMQIDAIGDGLQIIQEVVFENTSDRLYTNSLQINQNAFASVVVGLPPGAVGLGFPDDQRFVQAEEQNVVVDTVPVRPGEDHIVQMSYFLPYEDGAIIEQPVYYTFDGTARILVWPDSLTVTSDQLEPTDLQTIGDRTYEVFTGTPSLSPGDAVSFELSGTTAQASIEDGATPQPTGNTSTLLIIGLIVEIVIIAGVGYLFFKWRRARLSQTGPSRQLLIDGLIRQIAELDNQHEVGQIDDAVYQSQRAQLKTRLTELMAENSR